MNTLESEEKPTHEHCGFMNPMIFLSDDFYGEKWTLFRKSIATTKTWTYCSPNRIEPSSENLSSPDIKELQAILDLFEFEPGDFFRGSVSIWGTHNGNPRYTSVIYMDENFIVWENVLKK